MNDLELYDNEYLHVKLNNTWPLLFMFAFPDININLITDIDYSLHDFNYNFLIYSMLKSSYLRIKDDIETSRLNYLGAIKGVYPKLENILNKYDNFYSRSYKFDLYKILNVKLKLLILNKNKSLKTEYMNSDYIDSFYLNIYYDKFEIKNSDLDRPIILTFQEALNLAIYIKYAYIS